MTGRASASPGRASCLTAVLVIAAAGLLWRRPEIGLPPLLAKHGGSVLWGAMMVFVVGALVGRRPLALVAILAAAASAAVEIGQAIRYPPLDAVRATPLGGLLLGRTFAWWDIAAYWAGIALACLAVAAASRPGGGR